MILTKPSVVIETATPDAEKVIEMAGRVCYKSEGRATDNSAGPFIERLKASKHESVLEHANFTARFICDRGISHELVRHRLASFSQESTRYCNYGKEQFGRQLTFILPNWMDDGWLGEYASGDVLAVMNDEEHSLPNRSFIRALFNSELHYLGLLDAGWTPQQARSVLPNSLKTEVVMTANMREWRHIFKERTSPKAHPQMVEVMSILKAEAAQRWPFLFGDLMGV